MNISLILASLLCFVLMHRLAAVLAELSTHQFMIVRNVIITNASVYINDSSEITEPQSKTIGAPSPCSPAYRTHKGRRLSERGRLTHYSHRNKIKTHTHICTDGLTPCSVSSPGADGVFLILPAKQILASGITPPLHFSSSW